MSCAALTQQRVSSFASEFSATLCTKRVQLKEHRLSRYFNCEIYGSTAPLVYVNLDAIKLNRFACGAYEREILATRCNIQDSSLKLTEPGATSSLENNYRRRR
jgi:hypothetical protein